MTTSRQQEFLQVPADAAHSLCTCGRRIYWIRTAKGKRMPIDCEIDGAQRPRIEKTADGAIHYLGRGVPHFATCPQAAHFRRAR